MSDAAATSARRRRLEMRVTADQDALIRQAADIEDTTVTAFVLETATERAESVIERQRDLVVSDEALDRFIAELDKPAEPVAELVELFGRNPKLPEV